MQEAERLLLRALAIDPCAVRARVYLSELLRELGRRREQMAVLEAGKDSCFGSAMVRNALAFALATSLSAPALGRALDTFGQPRVLLPAALISSGMIAALAVATVRGATDPVLVALSAGSGLSFPVITPAMRGAWRVVLGADGDLAAAYAMDAVAVEAIFVGGPLLLSGLLVVAPPVVPLLVTAVLLCLAERIQATARIALTQRCRGLGPDQVVFVFDQGDYRPLQLGHGAPCRVEVARVARQPAEHPELERERADLGRVVAGPLRGGGGQIHAHVGHAGG